MRERKTNKSLEPVYLLYIQRERERERERMRNIQPAARASTAKNLK
jgi:hypothetical protein